MNLQAIAEFEHYFETSKNRQIYFRDDANSLTIRPSLFNFKVILDLVIIAGISSVYYSNPRDPVIFTCFILFFVVMFWIDLQSLNSVIIDLSNQR